MKNKFRAWDKRDKVSVYLTLDTFIGQYMDRERIEEAYEFFKNCGELGPWEQYIGLTDRNGVECFEDDVVNVTTDGEETVSVIKWLKEKEYSGWEIGRHTDFEIVGNLSENPELAPE